MSRYAARYRPTRALALSALALLASCTPPPASPNPPDTATPSTATATSPTTSPTSTSATTTSLARYSPPPGTALVASATWVTRNGEGALQVVPTSAARGWTDGGDAVWAEVVRLAPGSDTPGMRDQLVCHVQFAPRKDAWFLEPRRPAVGYAATVAAGCNPGAVPDAG